MPSEQHDHGGNTSAKEGATTKYPPRSKNTIVTKHPPANKIAMAKNPPLKHNGKAPAKKHIPTQASNMEQGTTGFIVFAESEMLSGQA
jgi:hypothetical protein